MQTQQRMTRWRLILGQESSGQFTAMNGGAAPALTQEQELMDRALAAIYNNTGLEGFGGKGGGAGRGQIGRAHV